MKPLFRFFLAIPLFLFLAATPARSATAPDTFVLASYGTLRTLDPAAAYDTVGTMRLLNLYEPLIFFDGGATDQFIPLLATQVPTLENGGISEDGTRYTFPIREGVRFHQGGTLTAEDVAYSFKRNMIADPDGGPMWMLLEALTGRGSTRDGDGNLVPGIFEKIDEAVTASGNTVTFHLPRPYPPLLGILAYSASVILDKEWAIENGCWDGDIANAAEYNNPAPGAEPLQRIANGTGAYRLQLWEPSRQFVFQRFDGYWDDAPPIKTAIVRYVKEWSTRKLMLQNGDADRVVVDTPYVPEVRQMDNVVLQKSPQLALTCACFCRRIRTQGNPNIGSGKLNGDGIPPDFFADADVRKGFLHAFDRETYKRDVFDGDVILPTSPNIQGLPHHREVPVHEFDLEKAKVHFQKAWDGAVWEKGFSMVVTHNTGNAMREAAAHMLADAIMSLNPKFRIEVRNVDWKDYLVQYRNRMYPLFLIGWGADYADPHNFLYTFMHSRGVYGRYMGYRNPEADRLLETGIAATDPEVREEIYFRLQDIWHEDAVALPLYQLVDIRAYRAGVTGAPPNPMFSQEWEYLKKVRK